MKTLQNGHGISIVVLLAITLFATCSDPAEDQDITPKEDEKEITKDEADALLETLSFTTSTKIPRITGTVPPVANTSLVKTNSGDTIYTMPGIKMPLRISHPVSTAVKGWYIAAKNSSFYFDVPIDDEEDSDSVSVVIIEVDPKNIELPYDIPVEITPYDEANQPIDSIKVIVTIEQPSSNGCDILIKGDTASVGKIDWIWSWTIVFDPDENPTFINAPNRVFSAIQHPTGCCNPGCPAIVCDPATNLCQTVFDSQVSAQTSYEIKNEFFNFYDNGTFARFTEEQKKNFDPIATDWCNKTAGYTDLDDVVWSYGTHDYVPGKTSISYATMRRECDDPLGICGYGSRGGKLMFTCHSMVITVDRLMLDFTKEVRMYMRATPNIIWRR